MYSPCNLVLTEIRGRNIVRQHIYIGPAIAKTPIHQLSIKCLVGNFPLLHKITTRVEPNTATPNEMFAHKLHCCWLRESRQRCENHLIERVGARASTLPTF